MFTRSATRRRLMITLVVVAAAFALPSVASAQGASCAAPDRSATMACCRSTSCACCPKGTAPAPVEGRVTTDSRATAMNALQVDSSRAGRLPRGPSCQCREETPAAPAPGGPTGPPLSVRSLAVSDIGCDTGDPSASTGLLGRPTPGFDHHRARTPLYLENARLRF